MKLNKEKIAFTGTIDAFLENALSIDDETLENNIMVENTIESAMKEFKMTRSEVIDLIESLHLEEVKRNLDQLIEKGMVEIIRYDENGDAIYGLTEKGKKFRENNWHFLKLWYIITTMKSYKPEVLVNGQWSTNGLRFATEAEAKASVDELMSRWYVPDDGRATECSDPVNYRFDFTTQKNVKIDE